jgi:hypothetical protein
MRLVNQRGTFEHFEKGLLPIRVLSTLRRYLRNVLDRAAKAVRGEFQGRNVGARPRAGSVIFAISLKAKSSSADWPLVEENLRRTLASVAASDDQRFHIVIAGHTAPTIDWTPNITFLEAPFPAPKTRARGARDKHRKRALIGAWLRSRGRAMTKVVFLDADDLINRRLVGHLRASKARAFIFTEGYCYTADRGALRPVPKLFHLMCGSSFAAEFSKADLPRSWEETDVPFRQFGKHGQSAETAAALGMTVERVPFPAAVYIVNHSESLIGVVWGRREAPGVDLPAAETAEILADDFAFTTEPQITKQSVG